MLVMGGWQGDGWPGSVAHSPARHAGRFQPGRVASLLLQLCMAMSCITLCAQVRLASAMSDPQQGAPRGGVAFAPHERQPMVPVPTKKLGKVPRIPRRLRDGSLQPRPVQGDVAAFSPPEA